MKSHDKDACQYLTEIPLHTWSKHAFHGSCKIPHITYNVCETFNAWVDNLRSITVLNLVDELRAKIMMKFYTKFFFCSASWPHSVGLRIMEAINKITKDTRFCKMKLAGRDFI